MKENFLKIQNETNIFLYVTIIDNSINRENFLKSQNKIFPNNGTQLYISVCINCTDEYGREEIKSEKVISVLLVPL